MAVLIDLRVILPFPSRTYGLGMCATQTFLTEEQRNVTSQSAAGKQDMKTQSLGRESLFVQNPRHYYYAAITCSAWKNPSQHSIKQPILSFYQTGLRSSINLAAENSQEYSQIFASSGQVWTDSANSHNLPVMLRSWASAPACCSLSGSPSGYRSNREWSPKLPANGAKRKHTGGMDEKKHAT